MDIITADDLDAKATFIHQVLGQGMEAVICRLIMQDARGLFDHRPANVQWEGKGCRWQPGEGRGLGWRGIYELEAGQCPPYGQDGSPNGANNNRWRPKEGRDWNHWKMGGDHLPKPAVPIETISKIAAARWDIENNGFHDLKTYWHLDHPYVHDPTAIEAWVAILVLAVNMVYSYSYMHLHHFREWMLPLKEIIQEMKEQMRWTMPRMICFGNRVNLS